MKKLSSSILLFIGASILLSSCGNRLISITKRHYRSGYYVDNVYKKSTVTQQAKKPVYTKQMLAVSPQVIAPIVVKVDRGNAVMPIAVKKQNVRLVTATNSKPVVNPHVLSTNMPEIVSANIPKVKTMRERLDQGDNYSSNARSLFWLVITILLILWLLAILSGGWGLGGLVNVLLVIALVLFILWLFRLI
ncbi:MAG: DUF5670 family protein [Bacteroidia bacterium]